MAMPAYRAAFLLAPTALNRKPSVVRDSIHQHARAKTTAMTKPIGTPPTEPTRPLCGMSSVCGMPLVLDDSACSGLRTIHQVTPATM